MLKARFLVCLVLTFSPLAFASTFTVSNTNLTGAGSLAQAILDANSNPGADIISFSLPSGSRIISPTNPLPVITDTVTIDGSLQTGYSNTPLIQIDGTIAGSGGVAGFNIATGACVIRGLSITRFSGPGVLITNGAGSRVEGCYLGVALDGVTRRGNGDAGIKIWSPDYFNLTTSNNVVGGAGGTRHNLISGNQYGIYIEDSQGNTILGNYIGTEKTGTLALGNTNSGVYFFDDLAAFNTIGGTNAGEANLISGNGESPYNYQADGVTFYACWSNVVVGNFIGVDVTGTSPIPNSEHGVNIVYGGSHTVGGAGAGNLISGNIVNGVNIGQQNEEDIAKPLSLPVLPEGNFVSGNLIGTDVTGQSAIPNQNDGVYIQSDIGNLIGGSGPGEGNVISANLNNGVEFSCCGGAYSNAVSGNLIGVTRTGALALGNTDYGVLCYSGFNSIGGTNANDANVIAYNGAAGVQVTYNSQSVPILGNSIYGNASLGIDLLGSYGVDANDPGDNDYGGNGVQNYPALGFPLQYASQIVVSGTLNSAANGIYRIELFDNSTNDPSGYGQGETYLGSVYLTTDGSGNGSFTFTNPTTLPLTDYITATATDTNGNTSEFSLARRVVQPNSVDLAVTLSDSSDPAPKATSFFYALTVANNGPANATGVVALDMLPTGLSFVSAVSSQGTCTQSAGVVTCNLGSLAVGAEATVTITVNGLITGSVTNAASVSAHETDNDLSNNSAAETTLLGVADLVVMMTDSPDPVVAGQPVTYTIITTNAGPDAASGANLGFYGDYNSYITGATTSQGSLVIFPQYVGCSFGTIPAHASVTNTVTAIPLVDGSVQNDASVQAIEYDPYYNNDTNLTTTVLSGPGVVQFNSAFYTLNESAGTATIGVIRSGGSLGTVSVNFATSNLTAIAGTDYVATNGTLYFSNGVTSASFQVKILDTGLAGCNESVLLHLFGPLGGGVILAGQTNVTLEIFNNHRTPAGLVECVSLAKSNLVTTADEGSFTPSISDDGRYVVFTSYADNLLASTALNGSEEIFLDDLLLATKTVVSLDTTGLVANASSSGPRISADGTHVAFFSYAAGLTTNSENGNQQLFIRDLVAGKNKLVSVNTNGAGGNSSATTFSMSTDGSKIAYTSYSSDLVRNDTNNNRDIFFFDSAAGSNVLVSVNSAGTGPGNSLSDDPAISADGHYVAFGSYASNLLPSDNNTRFDIFRRDTVAHATALVSVNTGGVAGNSSCGQDIFISGDGRYVAFESYDTDLGGSNPYFSQQVYVRDMQASTTFLVSVNNSNAVANSACNLRGLSRDGRFVLFESSAYNLYSNVPSYQSNVYLRDTLSNVTYLMNINMSGTAPGNDYTYNSALSANGRYVVFLSAATDLVSASKQAFVTDTFVRDMQTGVTTLQSTSYGGASGGDDSSYEAVVSTNGVVAFGSVADNLVPADINGSEDIFARAPGDTAPRLLTQGIGVTGDAGVFDQRITADGTKVAFASYAANLVQNDTNQASDIFLGDLISGAVTLVSVNAIGNGSGPGQSDQPRPSADGHFVAYRNRPLNQEEVARRASNFSVQSAQIYLGDTVSNLTALLSINKNGTAPGNNDSMNPQISSNGNFVVFESIASDLVANDLNGFSDVFIRSRTNNFVELVSSNASNTGSANAESHNPVVSADGRYVAFESYASNLGPPRSNTGLPAVYVRDRQTGSNILCSPNLSGTDSGNGSSYQPVLSASGRYVAFISDASDLVAGDTNSSADIFVFDVINRTLRLVSTTPGGIPGDSQSYNPTISADGRYVAFESSSDNLVANDSNGQIGDIFVRDLVGNTTTLVSVNCAGNGSGNDQSYNAHISGNGRYVTFQSYASDLAGGDFSADAGDIFRRDLQSGTTVLVSQNHTLLAGGNSDSHDPDISYGGTAVTFMSGATDLLLGDANNSDDLFAWSSGSIVGVDLALSKTASVGTIAQGGTLSDTLAVTNYGLANATGVIVTDSLPASLTFVSASTSQGTFTNNSGLFTCNVGNLNVAAGARIIINVTPTTAGYVTNTAICGSAQSDLASGNNSSTAIVLVTALPAPPLSVIVTNTSQLFLNWPDAGTAGYNLETSTNVAPGSLWVGVTNSVTDNSLIKYVILNMSLAEKARFYRLHHP